MVETRIAIVDDKSYLRAILMDKLADYAHLHVMLEACNGLDYLKQMQTLAPDQHPDIVLMDIAMDEMDGIEATRLSKGKYPHIQVIMLTVLDDDDKILSAIQAGANGYFLKDESGVQIANAIKEVQNGGASMSPSVALKAMQLLRAPSKKAQAAEVLSEREVEVLRLIAQGGRYKDIAEQLFISVDTVKSHIKNIYGKLEAKNKVEALKVARNWSLF